MAQAVFSVTFAAQTNKNQLFTHCFYNIRCKQADELFFLRKMHAPRLINHTWVPNQDIWLLVVPLDFHRFEPKHFQVPICQKMQHPMARVLEQTWKANSSLIIILPSYCFQWLTKEVINNKYHTTRHFCTPSSAFICSVQLISHTAAYPTTCFDCQLQFLSWLNDSNYKSATSKNEVWDSESVSWALYEGPLIHLYVFFIHLYVFFIHLYACFLHTFVCDFVCVFVIHLYAILYACFCHTFVCVFFFIHLYACFCHTFVCVFVCMFLSYICMRVCMRDFVIHLYVHK